MAFFKKKYNFNPETLLFETEESPRWVVVLREFIFILVTVAMSVLYFWIYTEILGKDLPKTIAIKKQNAEWVSRLHVMNSQLDSYEEIVSGLERRDSKIYRSIFGMSDVPAISAGEASDVRLDRTESRLDYLTRRVASVSRSFDEVAILSKNADNMASCIPAIPPLNPIPGSFRISSGMGSRIDPIYGTRRMHNGQDFACKIGTPVYTTGDGVVASINFSIFGYGNSVVIDHGFGYQTRYAHLSVINVVEGMKLKRGENIGLSGNSGKSSGPHLHYEVMYKGRFINPANFYDIEMSSSEYSALVKKSAEQSQAVMGTPNMSNITKRRQ